MNNKGSCTYPQQSRQAVIWYMHMRLCAKVVVQLAFVPESILCSNNPSSIIHHPPIHHPPSTPERITCYYHLAVPTDYAKAIPTRFLPYIYIFSFFPPSRLHLLCLVSSLPTQQRLNLPIATCTTHHHQYPVSPTTTTPPGDEQLSEGVCALAIHSFSHLCHWYYHHAKTTSHNLFFIAATTTTNNT